MPISDPRDWFAGLRALDQACFPKRCANCGHVYTSPADYCQQTEAIHPERLGLKAVNDELDGAFVELFRNCICGSTLLEFFGERRDFTESGHWRRRAFAELHDYLGQHGVDGQSARAELLHIMHGERSKQLELWYADISARAG